jgi:hypothetical protein
LKDIWHGFVEYPDPAPPQEAPRGKRIGPADHPILGDQ